MLDLTKYDSVGTALRDAVGRWPAEVCLIEADREKERSRLTYKQFGEAAEHVAAALEEASFAA
jgi:acyl-CoA synthetase (AMP-forming)/AMP-acid ligase II